MEKQIANVRNQMIGSVAFVFILAAWQSKFVYTGFLSNPYMIGAILGAFIFSCVIAFVFISKLKNEVIAFHALKEMWDDIRMEEREGARDPLWRHYRCAVPGRVFHRPRILGHAYDLVTEELARTKRIRVSVETMNTLVHKVEQSISDQRSLLVYMSGLLVFMGLIGTFIGLLKMVGSIGGILGALQTTGGGGNASDAFQKLLSDLQAPLAGMTTGFAASLFGLFGSLIVGLLARFAGQAAGVLKHEFEAWLAGVVQIGENDDADSATSEQTTATTRAVTVADGDTMRMVTAILHDYTRVAGSFEATTRALADLRNAQEAQAGLAEKMLGEITRLQQTQTRILGEVSTLVPIAPALRDLGAGLEAFGSTVTRRLELDVGQLREMLTDMDRSHSSALKLVSSNQVQVTTQMAAAFDRLSADIDRRTAAPSSAMLEATLERSLRAAVGEVGRTVAAQAERSDRQVAELVEVQSRLAAELAGGRAAPAGDGEALDRLGRRFETAMADGFGRMSQSMETAFAAYSSLLAVTVGSGATAAETVATRPDGAAPTSPVHPAVAEETAEAAAPAKPSATPAAPTAADEPLPVAEERAHFGRESDELERLLADFRARAAGGRAS